MFMCILLATKDKLIVTIPSIYSYISFNSDVPVFLTQGNVIIRAGNLKNHNF